MQTDCSFINFTDPGLEEREKERERQRQEQAEQTKKDLALAKLLA